MLVGICIGLVIGCNIGVGIMCLLQINSKEK